MTFAVQSQISLFRGDELVAQWTAGRWPESGFLDIMNIPVQQWEVVGDTTIVLTFENGIAMQLEDNSDAYECMQITVDGVLFVI